MMRPVTAAPSLDIQQVSSPSGIAFWLVEDHTVPIIAMRFAFAGGASQDPPELEGLARLLSATMDEGAGPYPSEQFRAQLDGLATRLSFDEGRDYFYGSLQTLKPNLDGAFELLRLALNEPRFDSEPVERMRAQIIADLQAGEKDPSRIARDRLLTEVFSGQDYGRLTRGTVETLEAMTLEDLRSAYAGMITREKLKIAVVGAVDSTQAGQLIDHAFAGLAETGEIKSISRQEVRPAKQFFVDLDVPQSTVYFALPGPLIDDADIYPAVLLAYILGGDGLTSRLFREIRESRGLAYSISLSLVNFAHAGLFVGATGTRNEAVNLAINVIEDEIEKIGRDGPSAEELQGAKDYVIGSYILRFTSSAKIASSLLGMQINNYGADHIDRRREIINAITLEDIRRVAKRFFLDRKPTIVRVGKKTSEDD